MKTLLFAPLFLDEPGRMERNLRWVKYYRTLKDHLGFDSIYMVDNASPMHMIANFEALCPDVTVRRFRVRLVKTEPCGYGMWYRAHAEAARFAIAHGYEKIIHLDSDVFILKSRFANWIRKINEGWQTVWCDRHDFPEANIQVICGEKIIDMYEFHTQWFLNYYPHDQAERRIPFTDINRRFVGDRYGEAGLPQSDCMDFYCQATNDIELRFHEI